jgi:hypothetical protein
LDKIKGSAAAASILQLTDARAQYDTESKGLLAKREFLAVILKHTIKEYEDMEYQDIADLIDGISRTTEISPGRTNQNLTTGVNTEFNVLNEKLSRFDVLFKVKDPKSITGEKTCFIHFDIEPQKNYRPGYPIEKRGIYYMSRMISSQLDVLSENTDYGALEKVYSIWICQDNIPQYEQNTVSMFGMSNLWNSKEMKLKKEDHDLMSMVLVRLGNPDEDSELDIISFLSALFYARDRKYYKTISKYVDFSDSLKMEVKKIMGSSELVEKYAEKRIVMNMIKEDFSIEQISKALKLSQEEVKEIINEHTMLV